SVSLFGLTVYWVRHAGVIQGWIRRLILSLLGFVVCLFIFFVTILTKIKEGSITALLFTALVVGVCYFIRYYNQKIERLKRELNESLEKPLLKGESNVAREIDPKLPTAIFFAKGTGPALHTILWVERMFPKHFKNYIFLSYGVVDTGSYGSDRALEALKLKTDHALKYLVDFAEEHGVAAKAVGDFGIDPIEGMSGLAAQISEEYPNSVFFAARYIYEKENILSRLIHSDFSLAIQRKLQSLGMRMLIIPLKI
ncbi:MAG: amino acid transporter, partial [Coxiellaceae bacterium]|nr:amino acid transporter [Coxiellaceae bacterium]